MSPYDPDEGPSITGWRVQCWESSLQPVVLHQIFASHSSSFGGQPPMQTVWSSRVNKSIPLMSNSKFCQSAAVASTLTDEQNLSESSAVKANRLSFDPYDLPSDVRALAQIVYSAHGGEVAVAFLRGGVHIFSGANFAPVDSYLINVGSAIAAPAFSSNGCCLASVWHETTKDRTVLKIIRVLPPAAINIQMKVFATWERAIADRYPKKSNVKMWHHLIYELTVIFKCLLIRFWWSLLVGVDWWDAVGCAQSAAEDGIGKNVEDTY